MADSPSPPHSGPCRAASPSLDHLVLIYTPQIQRGDEAGAAVDLQAAPALFAQLHPADDARFGAPDGGGGLLGAGAEGGVRGDAA